MKKFIRTVIVGALFGGVLCAWLSPHMISWYFAPPADLPFSCRPAVEWGISAYRKTLCMGMLLGAIFSGILFLAWKKHRSTPTGAPASS